MKLLSDDPEYLDFVGMQEQQYIAPSSDYIDEVKRRIAVGPSHFGEKLPWKKTFENVRLRPGEVSLWAGINGHGKSLLLGQVLLWLPQDQNCLVASLEMPPATTIDRMCRQTLPSGVPTDKYIDEFAQVTDNIWIYDQTDTVPPERMLAMVNYAAKKMSMNHIMIDSLVKCGIAPDDYSKQKYFVDRLCWIAKTNKTHIHLVCHIRKGEKESRTPDKFDIKGAGEISDLVDNVFIVHRNKDKERKIEAKQTVGELEPDAVIMVNKQRHGGWEGTISLYFHNTSQQFMSGPDHPLRWRI
jgi:twinkle protein